jgi:hypothetical protein
MGELGELVRGLFPSNYNEEQKAESAFLERESSDEVVVADIAKEMLKPRPHKRRRHRPRRARRKAVRRGTAALLVIAAVLLLAAMVILMVALR